MSCDVMANLRTFGLGSLERDFAGLTAKVFWRKAKGEGTHHAGAIAGDIIGSVHEGTLVKRKDFPLSVPQSCFTDDTVLTVASAILHGRDYGSSIREWGRPYPDAGYGLWFLDWLLRNEAPPYNSFGKWLCHPSLVCRLGFQRIG